MTKDEYEIKQQEILAELPEAFRGFASMQAWERGHAYGYEEVISVLSDLVFELKPAIKDYDNRIR